MFTSPVVIVSSILFVTVVIIIVMLILTGCYVAVGRRKKNIHSCIQDPVAM